MIGSQPLMGTIPVYLKNFCLYSIVLLLVVGLKYHYRLADSDDLDWILGPTAGLVEYVNRIPFEQETGTGYINRSHGIIIAPACAGVNFLIIAFCMAAFSGLHRQMTFCWKSIWLGLSFVLAYVLTITVNALRIVVSMYTLSTHVQYQWVRPDRLHRIEGIFIYFVFLCLFHFSLEKLFHSYLGCGLREKKRRFSEDKSDTWMMRVVLIPFLWYGLFTIGIPFLNQYTNQKSPRFGEHCLVILSICAVVVTIIFLLQLCLRRIRSKIGRSDRDRLIP